MHRQRELGATPGCLRSQSEPLPNGRPSGRGSERGASQRPWFQRRMLLLGLSDLDASLLLFEERIEHELVARLQIAVLDRQIG